MSQYGNTRPIEGLVRRGMNQPIPDLTQPPPVAVPGLDVLAPAPSGLAGQVANVFEGAVGLTMAGARFANMMRERDQQEFEAQQRYNAQTEAQFRAIESEFTKTIEGKADAQARLDIPILLGKLDRGEIVPPSNMSRESQIKWANDITDSQTSGQSEIFKERYKQMVSDNLVTGLQTKANAIAAQDKADIVYSLQNRAITATADDLARIKIEAAAIDVKDAEFDSKIVVPIIQQAASTGDAGRLDEIKFIVPEAMMDLWNSAKKQANLNEEANRIKSAKAVFDGSYQELARLNPAPKKAADIPALYSLRSGIVGQAQKYPEFADTANALINNIDSVITSQLKQSEKIAEDNLDATARAGKLEELFGRSTSPGLQKVAVMTADGVAYKVGDEVRAIGKGEADSLLKGVARQFYSEEKNRQPGVSANVAYGKWTAANGYQMEPERLALLSDARALKNATLSPNDPVSEAVIASASQNFNNYLELYNNDLVGQLGEMDSDMMLYENARIILESNGLAGKQMTVGEALVQSARFANKPRSIGTKEEQTLRIETQYAIRTNFFGLFDPEGEKRASDDIKELAYALLMRNQDLEPKDAIKSAAKIIKGRQRAINGHYTLFRDGVPETGYGDDYPIEDATEDIITDLHNLVKDDERYVWNNKKIDKDSIRLFQDPRSKAFSFIDNRTGDVITAYDDNGNLLAGGTFGKDSLKEAFDINAVRKHGIVASGNGYEYRPYLAPANLDGGMTPTNK